MQAHATLAAAGGALALCAGAAQAAEPNKWGALVSPRQAMEIALDRVCLPYIADGRPVAELALQEGLVKMPPKSAGAQPGDQVWRMGSIEHVNVIAWSDGQCSVHVDRGDEVNLRAAAEALILRRPEGFVRGRSGPQGGLVDRTVFCAPRGDARLVASITTPLPGARQIAFSSTVYRRQGDSPLCSQN